MKRILILGSNSYVAFFLGLELGLKNSVFGVSRSAQEEVIGVKNIVGNSIDMSFISSLLDKEKIDIVINCICMGIVDECERDQDQARILNYTHVKKLVELTNFKKIKLVHLSSNAVYDGDDPLYSENSVMEPKNCYGKVKAEADKFILEKSNDFLLIRPMTIYGPKKEFHRNNPATLIIHFLSQNKDMKLVNDVYGNLLYIEDLIRVSTQLIADNYTGVFNISGDEVVNRFELGQIIKKSLENCESNLEECSSDAFPSLAARAPNTSFLNKKIKDTIGYKFTRLEDGIKETISRMTK
ncbi:hypothetical protein A9Q84_05210 [Halobacteriovorax marinus]|uniref:RmlD-like substrate binding domain-containing protein n=1 Tax=Halobacteriovorax marinus TaxID=97084 RepID=A0A1Y5FGK6_9BACT|nr:hypothetical protein A9Q84_05210 [Halobacteriovorax marinus]